MQAYTSPLEMHSRMVELAMELLKSGHEFYAGALSSLALQFQAENNVEIEVRDVENA